MAASDVMRCVMRREDFAGGHVGATVRVRPDADRTRCSSAGHRSDQTGRITDCLRQVVLSFIHRLLARSRNDGSLDGTSPATSLSNPSMNDAFRE